MVRGAAVAGWLLLGLQAAAAGGTLTLGSIGDDPVEEVTAFSPLAGYLARHLQGQGIEQGRVLVAGDMQEMARWMREGRVDIFIDSPVPSLIVASLSGSRPVLRRWKQGVAEYRSVIFARADSGIGTLADLKGRTVAFEEPFSTAGYWLPRIGMEAQGLTLAADGAPLGATGLQTGFRFSMDDENTLFWVLKGVVSAGAMSDNLYREFTASGTGATSGLRVLSRSEPVPRHLVNLRAGFPAGLEAALVQVLTAMDESGEGREVLHGFERTARFDRIPPEQQASLAALAPLIARHPDN